MCNMAHVKFSHCTNIHSLFDNAGLKSWCGPAYLLFKNQCIYMWINRKSTEQALIGTCTTIELVEAVGKGTLSLTFMKNGISRKNLMNFFKLTSKHFSKWNKKLRDGLLSAIVKKRRETTCKTKCNMKASSSIMTRHRRTQDYAL